jgi:heavy metal translocating P-type ATPase
MLRLFSSDKKRVLITLLSGVSLLFSLGGWLQDFLFFDLAWIAIFLCGLPIIIGAGKALFYEHDIKADTLVSMALLSSLYIGEYFAAGEVAFIMQIGSILEDATAARASEELQKLVRLTANYAHIKRHGHTDSIRVEEIQVGDTLVVLAGETIPVDGLITSGQSAVNQAIMTGESIPVDKKAGDPVISGTLNQFGTFEMLAQKKPQDSALQRMIQLAKEAEEKKAPIISLTDKWATWMVILSFTTAVLTGVITREPIRAVTVLVVFCPCAFILATPTAIMAGIANAMKYGLLIKSGEALERCAKINRVAFDKTGTLTNGTPKVIAVVALQPGYSKETILELAAAAESLSEHPLGKAVCAAFGRPPAYQVKDFTLTAGNGISGFINNHPFLLGKTDFLAQNQVNLAPEHVSLVSTYQKQGATVICLSLSGQAIGILALADTIRTTAKATIASLAKLQVESILLTGDHLEVARQIAAQIGLKTIHADLLPEDKMSILQAYADKGLKLCMIGDGINDALALRTAYAGIAMGGIGSDIAVESSDVVLVHDDIGKIPYLFFIAQKTMRKINFNIIFSMLLNFLAVTLAVLGLLNPVTGALVHNCGSVFVVINSAFLLREQPSK